MLEHLQNNSIAKYIQIIYKIYLYIPKLLQKIPITKIGSRGDFTHQ